MSQATALYIVAAIMLLLIPIVPKMVALRVRVLRFVRLRGLADWHERHIVGISLGIRIVLGALAALCVYLGATVG